VPVTKIPIPNPVRHNGANTIKFATRKKKAMTPVSLSALATKLVRETSAYRDAILMLVPSNVSATSNVKKEKIMLQYLFVRLNAQIHAVKESAKVMLMRMSANSIVRLNCASKVFMKEIAVLRLIVHLINVNTTVG